MSSNSGGVDDDSVIRRQAASLRFLRALRSISGLNSSSFSCDRRVCMNKLQNKYTKEKFKTTKTR